MLDPLVQALFKGAEEAGLPVTFHLSPFIGYSYGLVVSAGLPELEETLQKFPKLKLFAHSQTFWAEMGARPTIEERMGYPKGEIGEEGRVPRLMRKYGNLYGDLSAGSGCNALTRDRAYGIKFLNEFQDRLCFGTDICYAKQELPLAGFLLELKAEGALSEETFEKIARGNARRLLKI